MAKYTIEYTEKGKVETLEFRGVKFTNTWISCTGGSETIEKCFEYQVEEAFPKINEYALQLIEDIARAFDDEISEVLSELANYES